MNSFEYNQLLSESSESKIKDIMVLLCNTGINYSDIKFLSKDDVLYDDENLKYIIYPKNNHKLSVTPIIMHDGLEVLKKYNFNGAELINGIEVNDELALKFNECSRFYYTKLMAEKIPLIMKPSKKLLSMDEVKDALSKYFHSKDIEFIDS